MSAVRVHVVVSGMVQGVFFRYSAAERAKELGLAGYVRNRADGCVEAEFEGSQHAVDEAVAWCKTGPPSARVGRVDAQSIDPLGETGFRIR